MGLRKLQAQMARGASVTKRTMALTPQKLKLIEALIDRRPDESLGDCCVRGGTTRITLWNWMKDPLFVAEYRQRVEDSLGSARGKVAKALVRGACTPGPGQAAMQKLYWQKLGEFVEQISGPNGKPIQVEHTVTFFDRYTKEQKAQLLRMIVRLEDERSARGELTEGEELIDVESSEVGS